MWGRGESGEESESLYSEFELEFEPEFELEFEPELELGLERP